MTGDRLTGEEAGKATPAEGCEEENHRVQVVPFLRPVSPRVKHLEGPLWEMRMKGRDGVSRAIYVTARGRRVVVVRVFIKKTPKTPRHEIDLALGRAMEVDQ